MKSKVAFYIEVFNRNPRCSDVSSVPLRRMVATRLVCCSLCLIYHHFYI